MKFRKGDDRQVGFPQVGFGPRLAIYYGAIFFFIGAFMPYFPVWLEWRGMSPSEISLVFALPTFVRILSTPVISYAADRLGNTRTILIILALGSLGTIIALFWATSFNMILLNALIFALFWTSIMPLTEAITMTGVRRDGLDYGRIRLWGSLAYIVASFAGGIIIQQYGPSSPVWLMLIAIIYVVVAGFFLPKPTGEGRVRKATLPPIIRTSEIWGLVKSPTFIIFIIAASAMQTTHAVYYLFATLHWQSLGYSGATIGALWAIGVIAEILLFAWSKPLLARWGTTNLLIISGVIAALRWAIMATDPPLGLLFPLQCLHAFTFGAAHLAAIHYISDNVPEHLGATAQGLYASASAGIFMGLAMIIAGPLYDAMGAGAYFVMSAIGAVGALAAIILAFMNRRAITKMRENT